MLVIGIIITNVLLATVLVSVCLLIRDVRRLHRIGKQLSDTPMGAGGVSAAGMTFFGHILE
jgi:hypothetical protein